MVSNQNRHKIIITIDGKASTGKSTLAKKLAREFNYLHIDTGAMYRAVTFYALKHHKTKKNQVNMQGLIKNLHKVHIEFKFDRFRQRCFLNGIDVENQIRTMDVSDSVSYISTFSQVRSYLVGLQRLMGKNKAVVMEGRDIGTVVFPEAECKFFLIADPKIRAKRRFEELIQIGKKIDYNQVLSNVMDRDEIDQSRKHSPLKKAKDAIEIDVSNLNAQEVYFKVKHMIHQQLTS
ncbi:MAG: (d)CMP kinase [Flavobacteriaceae bacterium]|nr:(d)CMP kinase [Flavobacteriaceae bacterium]MCY4266993.1 (d)CMP kinase [Flavobacteriaceae bacterium]MCY4298780.1 (d)CMP kinase [Flavobacteriaceae bacterium]